MQCLIFLQEIKINKSVKLSHRYIHIYIYIFKKMIFSLIILEY